MNQSVLKTRNLFLLGIATITIGLSLSKPLISLGQIILLISWILDGNLSAKVISFFKNKTTLVLGSIYFLTLFGLIYTHNFDYAIGDLRRKAALLGLPFLIVGFSPITNKEWKLIFTVYVGGVLMASFWSMYVYWGGINKIIVDVREYARFTSHIRFGLEICFAIFGSVFYFFRTPEILYKSLWLIIAIWLVVFMNIISLFTGVVVFAGVLLIVLLFLSFKSSNPFIRYPIILFLCSLLIGGVSFINNSINGESNSKNITPLKQMNFTDSGERYFNDVTSVMKDEKENGYFIWRNIAWHEMEEAWNKKSLIPFSELDLKGQKLSTTLIRFLTSKGLYKNAKSINQLTNEEIKSIEKGIANYKYLEMNPIKRRMNKIIWEFRNYQHGGNYNGHSVVMRWEYWKTAYRIFKDNPIIGVGTGDVQDAFNKQYDKDNSILTAEHRLRAHNQYFTYAVTFGVIGVVWFLFFLFFPIFKEKMYSNYTYIAFISIILLSFLTEDTLETQVGINFFALFNTLLLLQTKDAKEQQL